MQEDIKNIYKYAHNCDHFAIEDYRKTSRAKGNLARFILELRPFLHSIERNTNITPSFTFSEAIANVYYYKVTPESVDILVKLISEDFIEWIESARNISFYQRWEIKNIIDMSGVI